MNEQTTQNNFGAFYIVDLLKNLVKNKNIGALIYLILNVFVIFGVFYFFTSDFWSALGTTVLVYVVTSFATLSPLGEWIMRLTNSCRKLNPNDEEGRKILNRMEPIFQEVLDRARAKNPNMHIDPKIALFFAEDDELNAFAVGRRTICINTGLLQCSDEQIKGILAHELGHLANHDTDLTLLITVGNFFVSAIVTIFRFIVMLVHLLVRIVLFPFTHFLGTEGAIVGFFYGLMNTACELATLLCVNIVMFIWTKLGLLLVMHSSRKNEFAADMFACNLGYTDGLLSFFETLDAQDHSNMFKRSLIEKIKDKTSVFAVLASSHPRTSDRISNIKAAMTTVEA